MLSIAGFAGDKDAPYGPPAPAVEGWVNSEHLLFGNKGDVGLRYKGGNYIMVTNGGCAIGRRRRADSSVLRHERHGGQSHHCARRELLHHQLMADIQHPYPGISTWKNKFGATVLRLHYEADPIKGNGDKTFVSEINQELSPWALAQYQSMTDKSLFRQEICIDFAARSGQLLFNLDEAATLEPSFPIPHEWTRWCALDPHPRVPHAWLWCAVDPYGDRWYYREFWPSKVYGQPGNIPEDDNRYKIKQYCEVVKWMESEDNPENGGKAEDIYRRIIDPAARAFGKGTTDDEEQLNFQERYEQISSRSEHGVNYPLRFKDAVKDRDAGIELVNDGLKPLQVEIGGKWVTRSRIHIFSDKCPELTWQLRNNRWKQLTALQMTNQDPSQDPIQKRNHQTDLLRYIEMDRPYFVGAVKKQGDWTPITAGVNF